MFLELKLCGNVFIFTGILFLQQNLGDDILLFESNVMDFVFMQMEQCGRDAPPIFTFSVDQIDWTRANKFQAWQIKLFKPPGELATQ